MMADDPRSEMEKGFSRVDNEFAAVRADIKQSADDNHRYFQILTEQIRDFVKVVAEATAHKTRGGDPGEKRARPPPLECFWSEHPLGLFAARTRN